MPWNDRDAVVDDIPQVWKVVEQTQLSKRTLCEGDEASCRRFVTMNFPRPHIQQGQENVMADVVLVGPNGDREQLLGDDNWEAVES